MQTRSAAPHARHRVLLVDDDAVSLEVMALLLVHEGHQVLRAKDAHDALELVASNGMMRPDVLLVDLQMPGVSGGQLAESIRAMRGPGSHPLLLAMSATAAKRQQLSAFDGFLLKPLGLDDLRRALNPRKRDARPGPRMARSKVRIAHPGRAVEATGKSEVLNHDVVRKLLTLMPEKALYDVFAACIADTRACVHELKRHVPRQNETLLRQTAHRMKGAAEMVGATHIAGLAAGLEVGGNEEAATRAVLDDLLSACNALECMLSAGKIKESQGPPP